MEKTHTNKDAENIHFLLIWEYEDKCRAIADIFCEKQGLYFDFWLRGEVGGMLVCGDKNKSYHFNMTDIILDLKMQQEKGNIVKWFNRCGERGDLVFDTKYLSYLSWIEDGM